MAAVLTSIAEEIASLLESGGIGGAIARGAISGGAAIGVADLVNYLTGRTSTGNPQRDAMARSKAPRFTLVDLKKDVVITTMGPRRAYRFLIRPRRRGRRTKEVVIVNSSTGSTQKV